MSESQSMKDQQIKVVIADDHKLIRTGIKMMLEEMPSYQVVAETDGGLDTMKAVEEHSPDLLILDIQMPNLGGMEVLNRLAGDKKSPQVMVLSASEPSVFVSEAYSKGVYSYLPKEVDREEFEKALSYLKQGKKYVSPSIAEYLVHKSNNGAIGSLSQREKEVFRLLAEGKKNKEIAGMLFVSQRTIDTHRLNIMKKLGISTNSELTQLAMKHGVI